RLLTHVRDVMRQGSALPIVMADTPVSQALEVMSAKGMGMTVVTDAQHRPLGIFTDGDLRRLIARHGDIRSLTVEAGMTRSPRSINPEALAVEAARQMDEQRLNHMLVMDNDGALVGALHMHDLMAAKVV
ncbi:MAG TPA: D-arabinose 5-phosphate isomerase, partial [Achromobacter sp.]|nr:D-arabinose 5-phosphate isomerase [Achromobacter sp.]